MNCKYCDTQLIETAVFCNKCGKPIEVEKNEKIQIKGIGGWLSFFLFGLYASVFIQLIAGINDISGILGTTGSTKAWIYSFAFLYVLYYGGFIAFTIYTIRSFSKLKENAVSLGKMFLILIFLTNLFGIILLSLSGESVTISDLDSNQMILRSLALSIIWFLYLIISQRVNNTFPKESRKIKFCDKIIFFLLILTSILVYSLGYAVNVMVEYSAEQPTVLITEKMPENSQITGSMYRNFKYNFRINFPEDWKIETGDGLNIVQKASHENGTISIIVQQLDLKNNQGLTSIKDFGSSQELITTMMEDLKMNLSNVEIIDYGETKINNEPVYYVEYSSTYESLDNVFNMTNLVYILALDDVMYFISAGTETTEYAKIKPIFQHTASTFIIEHD